MGLFGKAKKDPVEDILNKMMAHIVNEVKSNDPKVKNVKSMSNLLSQVGIRLGQIKAELRRRKVFKEV